ncbi:MAG: type II toxin-antitoxin system prevent-host-death family antitoxin [Defluviitaleaceae bacterium]|nr:type II toxin-antitoxin system prevent-host-death family antitoxin [Defluviitaleaceae bacterium]
MRQVNIHEAKTHLSRLIEDVAKGEEFIIAKAGKPMARVVPFEQADMRRRGIGFLVGKMEMPDMENFDKLYQGEIIALFEGNYE